MCQTPRRSTALPRPKDLGAFLNESPDGPFAVSGLIPVFAWRGKALDQRPRLRPEFKANDARICDLPQCLARLLAKLEVNRE